MTASCLFFLRLIKRASSTVVIIIPLTTPAPIAIKGFDLRIPATQFDTLFATKLRFCHTEDQLHDFIPMMITVLGNVWAEYCLNAMEKQVVPLVDRLRLIVSQLQNMAALNITHGTCLRRNLNT